METDATNRSFGNSSKDMLFSKMIKAGSRIYYVDLKKCSTGDLLMTITESKKIASAPDSGEQPTFERHKVFIYQEDLYHFKEVFDEAMKFIAEEQLIPENLQRRNE